MKISKKILANKVRKLEVQNYDMRQKIKKMDELLTYLDGLTTELNHALPDPEYDARCAENAVAVGESLDRHAARLGLKNPELTGSDLCRAMLDKGFEYVMCLVGDECEESASSSETVRVVCSLGADYFDDTTEDMWYFAIPINNQGEPLNAKEVGL